MDTIIKTMPMLMMLFVGIMVQTSYSMQQAQIMIDHTRIYFANYEEQEGSDEVTLSRRYVLELDPRKSFFKPEGEDTAVIVITAKNIRETVLFEKFFGTTENQAIVDATAEDAIKEYEGKMSLLQKYPKTSALVVGGVSLAAGIALDRWFRK